MVSLETQARRLAQGPIESIAIDVARNCGVVRLRGGLGVSTPITFPATGGQPSIAHMLYSFADRTLQVTTEAGERATIEIGQPGEAVRGTGARVAYLDQCHWSALDRHLHEPSALAGDEAVAADTLIEWARAGRIILPLSSGHVIETIPLFGSKRRRLALTMLELSRGWHMRDPVLVRGEEILRVLGADAPGTHGPIEPFSLDPDGLYLNTTAPPEPTDLPGYVGWLCHRLTSVAANFDLLIDTERIPPEKSTAWCGQMAAIGRSPEFRRLPTARRRTAAHIQAIYDAVAEESVLTQLQQVGLAPERAAALLIGGLQGRRETMPFLRLYADALGVRLLNPTTKWVPNDLIDMLYLGCAAAYADAVAAEHTAAVYLTSAWHDRPETCPVVPTLSRLVAVLESQGLA